LKLETPDGFHLEWSWLDSDKIEIKYSVKKHALNWIGFGIGKSMTTADFLLVSFSNGTYQQRTPNNNKYKEPLIVPRSEEIVNNVKITSTEALLSVTFQFNNTAIKDLNLTRADTQTPILLSAYQADSTGNLQSLPQHTIYVDDLEVPFSCGHVPEPVDWGTIVGFMRDKDKGFMRFYINLGDCREVSDNFELVLDRLKQKTVYGMQGGMPPDHAWSLKRIHTFELWGKRKKEHRCPGDPQPIEQTQETGKVDLKR